ncbi:hypothetical protein ZWY2020_020939 [Hordeum vulgare]|nr:hypothetical protein ZWY2020_020939 [Hordeum vulgare]
MRQVLFYSECFLFEWELDGGVYIGISKNLTVPTLFPNSVKPERKLGIPVLEYQKEKFIKDDNENFVNEALYLVHFEVVGNTDKTPTIRSIIQYEVDDEHTGIASSVSTSTLACVAEAMAKYIKAQKGYGFSLCCCHGKVYEGAEGIWKRPRAN